ncbi:DUF6297 family protein [Streptomyces specialis]|uniref:DUF6297 family protein n=1 Tax=Streptomyces specialis TaxID=498367 RepID=UPI00073EEA5F|nr:DUF6297 family protein [Streptomyces specialis]
MTAETLAYLRAIRRDFRARKRGNMALTLYGVALVGGCWGVPLLVMAAERGHAQGPSEAWQARLLASLPVTVPALAVLVTVLMARGAVWRGPVLVDMPTVTWLLPTPLSRGALLLPRLASAALLAGLVGAGVGGVAGFLLSAPHARPWPLAAAAGAWAGATTALTGTAAGALVERHDRLMARHGTRIFGAAWAAVTLMAVGAATATAQGPPAWLAHLYLWSGPWGWSAQPLITALETGTSPAAPRWWAATPLAAASTTAALLFARRATPRISRAALRLRATTAVRVGASLLTLDLRQAREGIPALRDRGSRPPRRLPPPRHPWLVVPWRDATGLLRAPGRLAWAAVWSGTAVALTAAAPALQGTGRFSAVAGGLVAVYLAAAHLAEPARAESDAIRRPANLRCPPGSLALRHALVPAALLLTALGAGAAVCLLNGRGGPGTAVLVASVPAFVAAALVSAYRGTVPLTLLVGSDSPVGNTAPVQTALWYLRGPLAALALTAPVAEGAADGGTYGAGHLVWQILLGAAGLWWVHRRATAAHRG